jgi:hypothetical protein
LYAELKLDPYLLCPYVPRALEAVVLPAVGADAAVDVVVAAVAARAMLVGFVLGGVETDRFSS